ncbi:MAG: GGDEF domain-containing protein [Candidatus Omnitrophota bacterium]
MIKITKNKTIVEDDFLKDDGLDYNLLKIMAGEKEGSTAEQEAIRLKKISLKDGLYQEALYTLTNKTINDASKAKDLYFRILDHRNTLTTVIGRNVGIAVAAADYLQNICLLIKDPKIIESSRVSRFLQESMVDQKTGALGYNIFLKILTQEIERTKRYQHPFSLLFIDIDEFKRINDKHGHIAGDLVLKKIVATINRTIRSMDKLCRFGGDELICLLPETALTGAKLIAERITQNLSKITVEAEGRTITLKIDASIGITQSDPEIAKNAERLITAADRAMYKAKKKRKNRVALLKL